VTAAARQARYRRRRQETAPPDFAEATACATWCGDACTCGRGPESADLDPIDVAGMRAIEGRT
jgi:hypothetical protein